MNISNSDKIINSARKLLNEKIYEDITIKDICSESGISRQTFYNYFKNKDDVYKEFFRRISHSSSLFNPSISREYLFNDRYIIDVINFFDEFSDILIALENQNILWYLGKDLISSHKTNIFSVIPDNFLVKHQDYYYTYITSAISFVCFKWIRKGKPETKEELLEIIKYFTEYNRK